MARRWPAALLVLAAVAATLAAASAPAGAITASYRRWSGAKDYTCATAGSGARVSISDQNVEFSNLAAGDTFTINYIDDGVTTPYGPYAVEQYSGTKAYGSFSEDFDGFPFTFQFRLDTLRNGSVIYTSELAITCAAPGTGTVTPVNTAVATDQYRRWTTPKTVTCEHVGGEVRATVADQNVEFNRLPADATYKLVYTSMEGGVTATTTYGPYPVELTNGTKSYGAFGTPTFPSYPFGYSFRIDTYVSGVVVYSSSLDLSCTADGTRSVTPVQAAVTPSPFPDWASFITRQYTDLTAKAPTASNLALWVDRLSSGQRTKGDLIEALRRGADNTGNVDPAARLYRAFLQRTPDAGGLRFWVTRRRNGSWTLNRMAQQFATSHEFLTKYGALSNHDFVVRIYTDVLERSPDAGGVTYWTRQLDLRRRNRGTVMVGFSESSEYKTKQAENTDVAVAYIYLMGRAPTALEVADWVSRQRGGTSQAELAKELLTSTKYAAHTGL